MNLRSQSDSFGLVAWLKETRVRLPLRAIDIRFDITGTVADVHLDQVFSNDRDESLDVTYTFPLPAAAAVYRCEMIVDGKVITAVIEEEIEAKRQFVEAKAAGFKAALVEQHRDNVFSLQLGNVPARAVVVLRVSYLQELERLVDTVSLRIPTCPGVRYIPGAPLLRSNKGPGVVDDTDQVPDASLISPPRIDALHPDAAQISVRGWMSADDVAVSSILSPSHPLMARIRERRVEVTLALESALPDQDVMIRWSPQALSPDTAFTTSATYLGYHGALSRLKGPDLRIERRGPREVWFLIDRSGSMAGRNWEQSCQALHQALAQLHDDDLVGLSFFESAVQHFSDRPETVATLRRDPKLQQIVSLGTAGGTEMLPALQEVMKRWNKFSSDQNERHLVLITDGQVGNEGSILDLAKTLPSNLHVHPLGIDGAVNDAVLLKLAERTGGRCVFIHPNDSIVEATLAVISAIEEPVVKNVAVYAPWSAVNFAPKGLSHRGETSVLLKSDDASQPVRWTGLVTTMGEWHPRAIQQHSPSPGLVLLRVRREIEQLQARGERVQAVNLAKRFNLLCAGACFIAVDRSTKGQVATHQIYQPAMEEAEFGAVQDRAVPAAAPSFAGGSITRKMESTRSRGTAFQAPMQALKAAPSPLREIMKKVGAVFSPEPKDTPGSINGETLLGWLEQLLQATQVAAVREFLKAFIAVAKALPTIGAIDVRGTLSSRVVIVTKLVIDELTQKGVASGQSTQQLTIALAAMLPGTTDPRVFDDLQRSTGVAVAVTKP